jgi:ADP-ribose pyrophosphatase YjhB (NUDIX family)
MNDYYKTLPKKRMGSGALIFNEKEELLILKPNYKEHWSIPGGTVDENESPRQCCLREIKEEIGFDLGEISFLCVDYNSAQEDKTESLQFVFYGGILNAEQIKKITIQDDEIDEYKFVNINEALPLLNEKLKKRIEGCLESIKSDQAVYLENGKKI